MEDDRWCSCIALHDFKHEDIKWQEWFDYTLAIFTRHNLEPTRLGVNGSHYGKSSKSLTFKGGKKKLEKYNFEGITSLSLTAMPSKDDYTSNFIIDATLFPRLDRPKKSFVSICIDDKLEPFERTKIEQMAKELQQFTQAKYGYYFYRHLKYDPSIYPMGGNNTINPEDYLLCDIWGRTIFHNKESIYRTGHLRDIYRLNFLSREHLAWPVKDQQNLAQWIKAEPAHGELKELSPGFWSWYVEEERRPTIRKALEDSGILICSRARFEEAKKERGISSTWGDLTNVEWTGWDKPQIYEE